MREHGYDFPHQIGRVAAFLGFPVQLSSLPDVVCGVRNVNPDFPFAVFQFADGQGIVKIPGIQRIDGQSENITEIIFCSSCPKPLPYPDRVLIP